MAHVSGADPLARGQAPCLQDFEPVRELQRGSHAAVVMVKKRQTDDVFAMKVADATRLGRGAPPTHTHPQPPHPSHPAPLSTQVIDKHLGRTKRLQTERKVLFLCNSPFVVTIFFAFEDASRLYLVMECLHSDCKQMLPSAASSPSSRPSR